MTFPEFETVAGVLLRLSDKSPAAPRPQGAALPEIFRFTKKAQLI